MFLSEPANKRHVPALNFEPKEKSIKQILDHNCYAWMMPTRKKNLRISSSSMIVALFQQWQRLKFLSPLCMLLRLPPATQQSRKAPHVRCFRPLKKSPSPSSCGSFFFWCFIWSEKPHNFLFTQWVKYRTVIECPSVGKQLPFWKESSPNLALIGIHLKLGSQKRQSW